MRTSNYRKIFLTRFSFVDVWACRFIAFCLIGVAGLSALSCGASKAAAITKEELVRKTQELYDAASSGDQTPWKRYFAPDAMYFDEKGRNMDKNALVNDVTPLPTGFSGVLKLLNPQSRIIGSTAILATTSMKQK